MNYLFRYILVFLLLSSFSVTQAQEREMSRASKKFDQYAFVDSQKIFLKVAEAGYESAELFSKLADSYYFNANYREAAVWYGRLVEKFPEETSSDQYFRYAQALRATQQYDKAEDMFAKYKERLSSERLSLFEEGRTGGVRTGYVRGTYEIKRLDINAVGYSDFGPAYYGEKLLFASTRDTGTFTTRIHKWNNQPFLDFYTAELRDGEAMNIQKLPGNINTPYHESTAVLSPDGNTLYFTRNNYTNNELRKDKNRTTKLKLYKSVRNEGGAWGKATELPFNQDAYSVAHPAISPDGKTLYFASDMERSFGESDLWKVTISEDGSYGTPENLGTSVNTVGRETFPFIAANGDLYFSTDGREGLGGLDVYVLDAEDQKLYNVGEPVNSPKDDFTFIINQADNTGFFASNRGSDNLDDDIYSFVKALCESKVTLTVLDKLTKQPLSGAKVYVRDIDNQLVNSGTTIAPASVYVFGDPECGEDYFIRAEYEGYNTAEKLVMLPEQSENLQVTIELEPSITPIPPDFDLAALIQPIFFDFDKSNIRPDAAVELAKIIEIMKEFPQLRIDVRSHTDSRGNDAYNMALSERRNQATIDYIVEEGDIDRSRVTGRGYGETQLLNECSNGVPCTEVQHQMNRRSEFLVQDY